MRPELVARLYTPLHLSLGGASSYERFYKTYRGDVPYANLFFSLQDVKYFTELWV